ncbi:MAG: low molecular weight protein-tyrosine-phosphatase [Acidimicrobiales bacterium]
MKPTRSCTLDRRATASATVTAAPIRKGDDPIEHHSEATRDQPDDRTDDDRTGDDGGGRPDGEPIRLLFVCLGNICRSPTAEAVMGHLIERAGLAERIEVDSAGTSGWHVGDPPDERATAEAGRRGVAMRSSARAFHPGDYERYDLILAMDRTNLADLHDVAPDGHLRERAVLLRSFDPAVPDGHAAEVPDPYYGGPDGFADVYDLIHAACTGLLDHLVDTHALEQPHA